MTRKIVSKFNFAWYLLYLSITFFSCAAMPRQPQNNGVVYCITNFFDTTGNPKLTDTLKIWYKDSMAVEEIHRININTDTSGRTRVSYTTLFYRYTNPATKIWQDYSTFSDTATLLKKGVLPDSIFQDRVGWNFYSSNLLPIIGQPRLLGDTIMENVLYKKATLKLAGSNRGNGFSTGYFRCDGKPLLFSLEKSFSKRINCSLTRLVDHRSGRSSPYAVIEIKFISDSLSSEQIAVFDLWEKKAR